MAESGCVRKNADMNTTETPITADAEQAAPVTLRLGFLENVTHASALVCDNTSVEVRGGQPSEGRSPDFLHQMFIGRFGLALGDMVEQRLPIG